MMDYNPRDWFWLIGADSSQAWSSASAAYVTEWDAERTSRIANEVELYDVLARAGLSTRAPQGPYTVAAVRAALLAVDAERTGSANDAVALAEVAELIGFQLPPVA